MALGAGQLWVHAEIRSQAGPKSPQLSSARAMLHASLAIPRMQSEKLFYRHADHACASPTGPLSSYMLVHGFWLLMCYRQGIMAKPVACDTPAMCGQVN